MKEASAAELDRAESEAKHAGEEFEDALLRLKDAVTQATRPEFVRTEAKRIVTEDPLRALSVIFAAGVLVGAWITSFPQRERLTGL